MRASINIESIQPCFNASSSIVAWATADGRVRLYHACGQKKVTDITDTLGRLHDGNRVYSCLLWGPNVRW